MQPAVDLRAKIASSDPVLGLLVNDHLWPGLVESAKRAGLDYIIVDLEHGAFDTGDVAAVCQIGRLANFPVLIRCVSTDSAVIGRALDMGPCGLMFPGIEETATLNAVRDAIYMPPRGRRRPGGPVVDWLGDVQYDTWKREVEDHLIILPQIETGRGVENAREIARHEIVTSIAVGPYDLSADLGCCYDPSAPALKQALATIREAGEAAQKAMWMIGSDAQALIAAGYRFLCIGEPMSILESALRQQVASTRNP